jgi:hypothetical protein
MDRVSNKEQATLESIHEQTTWRGRVSLSPMSELPLPPIMPLQYHTPATQARPGILTAIGVLSIVLGVLSFLSNAGSVLSTIGLYIFALSVRRTPSTSPSIAPATQPFFMDPVAAVVNGGAGLVGIVAAVILVIAGIQLLRNKLSARKLHLAFIAIKFPQVVIATVASWMWYTSIFSERTHVHNSGAPSAIVTSLIPVFSAIAGALFSLIYPIALIIVLKTAVAKRYFDSLRGSRPTSIQAA